MPMFARRTSVSVAFAERDWRVRAAALLLGAAGVCGLMGAAGGAHAATGHGDGHGGGDAGGHAPAAEHAGAGHGDAKDPSPAARPAVMRDPMAALREKLAARLGARTAVQDDKVVRVVARSDGHGDGHGAAPKGHGAEPGHDAKAGHGAAGAHGSDGHGATHVAKAEPSHRAHKPSRAHRAKRPHRAKRAHAVHWDYIGPGAPEHWASLKPEYSACGRGNRQSPIDIRGGVHVDLAPIVFEYEPSDFSVVDNGHTVKVNVAGGNSIEVMGRRYDLVQFHFHRPSEERINGRQFDMSLHMVHRDPEGRLAVVAVLMDRGDAHPVVQAVWNNLPLERHQELFAQELLDPGQLLPADRRYYTYMGSLTTPPCTEGVLWMVMQQPVGVDRHQIGIFSRLYPMNARPVQQASGRLIKASN